MWWLQYSLLLLAEAIVAQNSSGFHLISPSPISISNRVNFAAATEDEVLETVLAGSLAAATVEENATEEIIQSSQVSSGSSIILCMHAGFAILHSWP